MIRALLKEDIPWVVNQEQLIFGHSLGEGHYITLFELGDLFGYVKDDKVLKGALICSKNGEHVQIENLFVLESYRQGGIAKQLLSQLKHDAALLSIRYISLEVRVDLPVVISLYESMEFKTVKRISNYYPDHTDAYYMVYERSDA
jgi:ribosomal protein S18 acetylase RimI-like enzyme